MLSTAVKRPLVIRFLKPSVVDLTNRQVNCSVVPSAHPQLEKQNEYDVEFDERAMGVELTQRKLVVTLVHAGGQGEEKGVKLGSRIIKVEGEKVNGLDSLAAAMVSVGRPVTLTFRDKKERKERARTRPAEVASSAVEERGRRTTKRSSGTKAPKIQVKTATDEKAYMAWLYGKDSSGKGSPSKKSQEEQSYLRLVEKANSRLSAAGEPIKTLL
jgi:hypothetical protein